MVKAAKNVIENDICSTCVGMCVVTRNIQQKKCFGCAHVRVVVANELVICLQMSVREKKLGKILFRDIPNISLSNGNSKRMYINLYQSSPTEKAIGNTRISERERKRNFFFLHVGFISKTSSFACVLSVCGCFCVVVDKYNNFCVYLHVYRCCS